MRRKPRKFHLKFESVSHACPGLCRSLSGLIVLLSYGLAAAVPAVKDAVIYEVNLRAFSEAGDLDGVTARLDNIQQLGANVIWLMPIHPIGVPNRVPPLGSPYSVQDYRLIGSEYGTASNLRALISGARARGISVMMDWVANHTAWDHAWLGAHPDWYTQDDQGQIIHPPGTNWLDVADLNYDNLAMRSAMIDEIEYWAGNFDIDGFRFDAADLVPFDFWQQAIPAVRMAANRPLLMLAEGSRSDHFTAGFDMTYDWNFYNAAKSVFRENASATALATAHAASTAGVPQGASVMRFTTNHDESAFDATPPVLFGSLEASLAAYAATLAYGGTPLVYAGQEIGWTENVPFFSNETLDWSTGQDTLAWYTSLLEIRENSEPWRSGSVADSSDQDIVFVRRESGNERIVIAVNTRDHANTVTVPFSWQGAYVDQFTGRNQRLRQSLQLDPFEVVVLTPGRIPVRTFEAIDATNKNNLIPEPQMVGPWILVAGLFCRSARK